MITPNQATDVAVSVPPVTVAAMSIFGHPLNDYLILMSMIWLSMLIMGWLYDRFFKDAYMLHLKGIKNRRHDGVVHVIPLTQEDEKVDVPTDIPN
jgi:hypothetical protein